MPNYKYLIIGGGMTADAAISSIREVDPSGSIGMISTETHPPYKRPPLSKGLWKGKPLETIFLNAEQNAKLHLGIKVTSIDPENKTAKDDQGLIYAYEKLLVATGGSPRRLPFGGDDVIYFRTLDDYQHLHSLTEQGARFAVIGGGFIGSEIASALADQEQEVVMVFPEEGIGSLLFPADLARYINEYYRQKGVKVLSGELVNSIERRGEEIALTFKSGQEILVDHVVAGIGILPNVSLAEEAGIEIDNGILVDGHLQTNQTDIYAAGDVANIYNPLLDKRLRVEHEDNALSSGRIAGLNMAGKSTPYDHLSYFYSDLFELGYEAVGELDPRMEVFSDWDEPFQKGVIYYLKDDRVRGVLLWNVWGQVEAARKLIAESKPVTKEELKGRLPE